MNLSTTWLGLELPHPFIVGASPLGDTLDGARRAEDAGAAALVLRSLHEEQLHAEALATHHSTEHHAEAHAEAMSYFPTPDEFVLGPDAYLAHIARLKKSLGIPVIASLNGATPGGWLTFATAMEQAGADALELNLYDVPADPDISGEMIEARSVEMVASVREAVEVPIAVKLSPFYTSLPHFATRLEEAGAQGLVLFNRFYEVDIDIEELLLLSHLELSDWHELLLRLRWLAILSAERPVDFAVSGGVHAPEDAVKAIMAGACTVQMVSALLRHGLEHLGRIRAGVAHWLETHEYESLRQMLGSMNRRRCPDPAALERANYVRMLQTWSAQLS